MKTLLSLSVLLLVSGCSIFGYTPNKPDTIIEYREISVPVPKTPMPPNTDCPKTDLELITPVMVDDNADLVKAYRITVAQLRDCSDLRQKVLDKYREIAKSDADIISNIPSANSQFRASSSTGMPSDDVVREIRITRDFSDLEEQFRDLKNKEYVIK